jgi:hypothetical protein
MSNYYVLLLCFPCLLISCLIVGFILLCIPVKYMVGTIPVGPFLMLIPTCIIAFGAIATLIRGLIWLCYEKCKQPLPQEGLQVVVEDAPRHEPSLSTFTRITVLGASEADGICVICYALLNAGEYRQCVRCRDGKVCGHCFGVMRGMPMACPVCRLPWALFIPNNTLLETEL